MILFALIWILATGHGRGAAAPAPRPAAHPTATAAATDGGYTCAHNRYRSVACGAAQ